MAETSDSNRVMDTGQPERAGLSETTALSEARFWEVTRRWQKGEITRGEAAALLGMTLLDYEARLRRDMIRQEREPRTPEEERQLEEIAGTLRGSSRAP